MEYASQCLCVTILAICIGFSSQNSMAYSREVVQSEYPGFGTEYMVFPSDDASSEVIGYYHAPRLDFAPFGSVKDTYFVLYTRENPNGILLRNKDDMQNVKFDNTKKTKIVTHGWLSSGNSSTCILIKNALLQKYDANVFVFHWEEISGNKFYPIPLSFVPDVGVWYGKFLNHLVDKYRADPSDMHLIGHSLGAHVSGYAGRSIKHGKIGRITGLDPALPGISDGYLSMKDAEFVDIIHTCANLLGFALPTGHVDFYPNRGCPPQPGCAQISKMIEGCSHGSSWKFFLESIENEKQFLSYKCSPFSFDFCLDVSTCGGKSVPMGEGCPLDARGVYFAATEPAKVYN